MKLIPINSENMANCHKINEDNVPEVGSKSLSEFESLVNNSDFNLCVLIEDIVVGYIVCFQDTEDTHEYLIELDHKNYQQWKQRLNNFLYIDRIAIDESFRNKQIASRLYDEVIKFSNKNAISHLTAEVNLLPTKNIPSFLFHEKYDFTEFDTVKYTEDYEVSLQVRMNS
ncbi:GNAT family N-acetyltransferase [Acidimicrobiia bacterium]|nr:GNAT family N-acetyltransferase [Acidimicrobiia bacterium]